MKYIDILTYNITVIDKNNLDRFVLIALPSPPIDVKVSDVTSTSVKLSWSHPNPDDIQYYTISHKPRSASQSPGVISGVVTMYYTIRPLSPYTQYEFTISAVNGFGHGPPSPPIVATTGETGNITLNKISCQTPPKNKTQPLIFFRILLYFITVLSPLLLFVT